MTEYRELKAQLLKPIWEWVGTKLTAEHADQIMNEQLSIIAERCWLKDEGRLPQLQPINEPEEYLILDGWRPVLEIKKEAK